MVSIKSMVALLATTPTKAAAAVLSPLKLLARALELLSSVLKLLLID
jgi:hypothetical protein